MIVRFPEWNKLINEAFIPLINCEDRFLIMYGSRDSTKTSFAVRLLIYRCLTEKYFKCIMIRRYYAWIRESVFAEVKDTIIDMGLESLFKFRENPYEIECINGNKFVGRGTDDVKSIKSVKNPTITWYEEDVVYMPENDWLTIVTSIRSHKARFLQDIYTINPQVEGQDYNENWFYKRFFKDNQSKGLSFRTSQTFEVRGETIELAATVHHSTWRDNKWLNPVNAAMYEEIKKTNDYEGSIYVDGLWANRSSSGLFYHAFSRHKHVDDVKYNPNKPIHLTFDFNVRPYVSASIWQVYEPDEDHEYSKLAMLKSKTKVLPRVLVKVAEIASKPPRNRTGFACEEFSQRFAQHLDAVYLYGDPSGKKEDTRSEQGANDFTIIMKELEFFRPKKRVQEAAPSVAKRGDFINSMLSGYTDTAILISGECTESIRDYTGGKVDSQGTKLKEKAKDADGVSYEKFHHFTDGDDYFITKFLQKDFKEYLRGGRKRSYGSVDIAKFNAR